jgi:hypothetical protein
MTRRTRKRTTIITETDRLVILSRPSGAVEGWCDNVNGLLNSSQPEEAAELTAFRLQAELPSVKVEEPSSWEGRRGLRRADLRSRFKPA